LAFQDSLREVPHHRFVLDQQVHSIDIFYLASVPSCAPAFPEMILPPLCFVLKKMDDGEKIISNNPVHPNNRTSVLSRVLHR
jgi:hypothetical protein